jgi:hypothetical protein
LSSLSSHHRKNDTMARSKATARNPKGGGARKVPGEKAAPAKKGPKSKQGKGHVGKGSAKYAPPKRGERRSARAHPEKRKPVTAEELEADMDDYWLKSGNKEVAAKKLDEEMDSYWEKKNAAKADEGETEDVAEDANPEAS